MKRCGYTPDSSWPMAMPRRSSSNMSHRWHMRRVDIRLRHNHHVLPQLALHYASTKTALGQWSSKLSRCIYAIRQDASLQSLRAECPACRHRILCPHRIEAPHFSVTISCEDGQVCYDTNTTVTGLCLAALQGRGRIALQIERLDLNGGAITLMLGPMSGIGRMPMTITGMSIHCTSVRVEERKGSCVPLPAGRPEILDFAKTSVSRPEGPIVLYNV